MVATTDEPESMEIESIAMKNNYGCFHGNLNDVLDRFYQAAKNIQPDYVVRLTSDCPLIDPFYIDDLIKKFLERNVDYATNCLVPTLPDGMDAEIFKFTALETAWREASKKSEREHVTPFIRESGKFKIFSVEYPLDLGSFRLTLDTSEDYELIKKLIAETGEEATLDNFLQSLKRNPEWLKINSQYERNEGLKKSLQNDKE